MIPRLDNDGLVTPPAPGFFERLIEAGFRGDIEGKQASRTVYATDNSIYQMTPQAILFPQDAEDMKTVALVLGEPAFAGLSVTPRGGGTGTNGQSLTSGIVVDCSRHMNRIVEIDPQRRIARVESGVIKDQLNRALKPYGLFFAPELSTSNRATIGGMISTDACGQGSCLYGKTSGHVRGLRVVLTDGTDFWSRPMDTATLEKMTKRGDRVGAIHRTVARIATEKSDEIAAIFPKLNRYMTGYDLAHIFRDDGRFDLNSVLCGSEGTLAMIAEAELNLLPIPKYAALINIRYNDFNTALEDARTLTALRVASVETIDEKVLGLAKGDIIWSGIARFFPEDTAGPANGLNIVEVLADDEAGLVRKLAEITNVLDNAGNASHLGYTTTREMTDIEAIWTMRKRAVGLLGNVEGPVRPVPFVEDTAVPPENLAAYIREFRALLESEGLSYGMFGHVDAGVLHLRPALDLTRSDHEPLVRRISDAVVALTLKYGGVLWGEHGKGVRSEYVPEFFGPLYPCLQEIKAAFDPQNRLNPGKIAAPDTKPLLRIDEVPLRGHLDRTIPDDIRAAFDNAAYCNGNGACFDFDETSAMCPSYKATRDRRFSPKGRASLMREWLRLLAAKGVDPRREAAGLRRTNRVMTIARRAFNTVNPANRKDFSHQVREAMDTCLACKACAGQCPVKVSVPAFRAKFMELYHGRYLRPLKDPLIGAIETILPLAARFRPLYNAAMESGIGQAAMKRVGLTALPVLPGANLASELSAFATDIATPERIEHLSPQERARTVVIVADAFTAHFDPKVVAAFVELATAMGFRPWLAAPVKNGKALHVHGYLGAFGKVATRTTAYLEQLAEMGVMLVGLDPSMTLAFRSEYRDALGTAPKAIVQLPQEWLSAHLDRLPETQAHAAATRFLLMAHCTEKTNAPAATRQWSAVFARLGIALEVVNTGCCGMAGTFGHETRNRGISESLYAMSWKPALARTDRLDITMATGFSCRSQAWKIDARRLPHPLEVLATLSRMA